MYLFTSTISLKLSVCYFAEIQTKFYVKKSVFVGNFTTLFFLKIFAVEGNRTFVEVYSNHTLFETTCKNLFRCFKNNDFDHEDKKCSVVPKTFEDEQLEALLQKTHVTR